jgi:branched-chain amino acid transport system ATP-binding protein
MVATGAELSLAHVSAGYGSMCVIEDISFGVRCSEKVGIIGRNGAGKTTTLGAIMGLVDHHSGSVKIDNAELTDESTYLRARRGIGYVPQTRDIFASLTVEGNLTAALQGRSLERIEVAYDLFPRLRERRAHLGNRLSGGEQQMLSVARALMSEPRFLLLDEPLEGIAPQLADEMMDAIVRMVDRAGVGCILVEQHVDVVLDFADSIVVLERGRIVFYGPTHELRGNIHLLEAAIGLGKPMPARKPS